MDELFLEPLQFAFMERALMAAILVGLISGLVGSFVVVRGMSFFGDALAHSILPGVALAFIYGQDIFWGGLVAGIGTALGIGWLTRHQRLKEDTAIGVVFAGMFALGIAIISTSSRYSVDLTHILFGNILGVSSNDLEIMLVCGVVVLASILVFYKEFLLISFDANLAKTLKLPSESLRLLLLVLIAITVVASLRIVGVSLMLAMLVTPAATVQLFVTRFHWMMFFSALLGALSGVAGIFISYHREIPTGPAIVLTATAFFVIGFGVHQLQSYFSHHH